MSKKQLKIVLLSFLVLYALWFVNLILACRISESQRTVCHAACNSQSLKDKVASDSVIFYHHVAVCRCESAPFRIDTDGGIVP